jgi:hypothetical protein
VIHAVGRNRGARRAYARGMRAFLAGFTLLPFAMISLFVARDARA